MKNYKFIYYTFFLLFITSCNCFPIESDYSRGESDLDERNDGYEEESAKLEKLARLSRITNVPLELLIVLDKTHPVHFFGIIMV